MKKTLWRQVLMLLALTAVLTVCAAAAELPREEYFGRSALVQLPNGEALLRAYDQLDEGVSSFEADIPIGSAEYPINVEELLQVLRTYCGDHPEKIWMTEACSYYYPVNGVCRILPQYTMSQTEAEAAFARMEAAAETLLEGIHDGMGELEKEFLIHDRLAEHVTYNGSANCHNAYGALAEGVAVCDGYTGAFQYLLAKVGIQSYKVTGTSRGEGHAWNLVRIDGAYYYVDVTWDDQGDDIYHAWTNITTGQLEEDHVIDLSRNTLPLPECTATAANYFAVYGGELEELTVAGVAELFRTSKDGVARFYAAMDGHESVPAWYQNNIRAIVTELGIFGGVSYSYSQCGREYHLTINGYVPPASSEHRHVPVTVPAVEPTCTEDGLTKGSRCLECGEVLQAAKKVPALGHSETAIPGVEATCTTPGLSDGLQCLWCLEVLVEQQEVPAKGHSYDGDQDAECNACGEMREVEQPETPKAAVSGKVSGGKGGIVQAGEKQVPLNEDGSFTLEALQGGFDLIIAVPGCLTYTVKNITAEEDIDLGTIALVQGDVNGDNMINIMDMGAFRADFGKAGEEIADPLTDVTGDGVVNIMDMGVFRRSFGKTAAKDCTVIYQS